MSRQVDLGQIVPNIQVGTTTTGTPSTPASVVNEGTDLNPVLNFTIPKGDVGPQGPQGIQGIQGETGNGIASIAKTSTSGLVDTYTITFTNGQTTTFEVTNGANGDVVDVQVDGTSVVDNGIANIVGLAEMKQELEDMYNLLPKVSGTGETITLDGTVAGKMLINLKGNTSQEGTPTPDSPQDIHVVSGNNSIEVCGKNLFDESYYNNYNLYTKSISYYSYIEMPDSFKTKFYGNMSLKGTAQELLFGFSTTNNSIPYERRMLSAGTIRSNVEYDFTNATNVYLIIGNGFGITLATDIPKIFENYNIMVSKASNEPYEAYKGASYPINLGDIELCKIGDYQDSIVKDNGKWYLNKQIGKVVLDGTETFDGGSGTRWNYTPTLLPKLGSATSPNAISNYYTSKFSTDNNSIYVSGANKYISIMENRFSNVSGFKTWLASNNVTIYYVLNTPTYTEITGSTLLSQLEAVKRSYTSQTNISQNNDDLPFIINATALKEMA